VLQIRAAEHLKLSAVNLLKTTERKRTISRNNDINIPDTTVPDAITLKLVHDAFINLNLNNVDLHEPDDGFVVVPRLYGAPEGTCRKNFSISFSRDAISCARDRKYFSACPFVGSVVLHLQAGGPSCCLFVSVWAFVTIKSVFETAE